MKNSFFFLLFLFLLLLSFCLPAQASFRLQGGSATQLTFSAGTFLVTDSTNTYLNNTVEGDGTLKMTGDLVVDLSTGDALIPRLEIAKAPGSWVSLTDTSGVSELVSFTNNENYVLTNTALFVIGAGAQVQGHGPNAFFATDAPAGGVKKVALDQNGFEFPVGANPLTYNPILLVEEEAQGDFTVRCLENVHPGGAESSGAPLTFEVVDASWEITPASPNPTFSILEAEWTGTDELPGFDRARCGIARYDATVGSWDLLAGNVAPAFGSDPYGRERLALTEGGFFAVGGRILAPETTAEIDVLLGGNYQGAGLMGDGLRAGNLLPPLEPYTGLGFQHRGFGGGEAVAPAVFAVTGPDAIVDYLFIEIRDGEDPEQVVTTQTALLQRDGDIVGTDGMSPLRLGGIAPGQYHVAIHHRNHLAIRTATPLEFGPDGVEYSFLVDPDQALGGVNAVRDLGDGFFALVPGDVDQNGQVQNTDATTLSLDLGGSGYRSADTDLNGQVQNIDLQLRLTPNLGRGRQF